MLTRLFGSDRSRRVANNVLVGLLARSGMIALMFYSTRLMLDLLGAESLGVWLVVLSLLQWVTFFDLGIALGARNEIARNLAMGNAAAAAHTISTAYFYCALVALCVGVVVLVLAVLPIDTFLQEKVLSGHNPGIVIGVCVAAFLLNFVLGFVQQIYNAQEKSAVTPLYGFFVNAVFVLALLLFSAMGSTSVLQVAIAYCVAMLLPNILLSYVLFSQHVGLRPSIKNIRLELGGRIFSVGIPVFFIQLSGLVIFATDRVLVSMVAGPADVVVYDAGFKVFSIVNTVHLLIMGALWSSFTHAYVQRDWVWIRSVLRRLQYLMLPLVAGCVLLAMLAPKLVRLWLGEAAVGPHVLYVGFAVFCVLSCWSNIYAYFLNGIGNVQLQMYSALCAAAVNIPLSLFFAKSMGMGVAGIIWGTVVSLCFFSVIGPLQTAYVLRKEVVQ